MANCQNLNEKSRREIKFEINYWRCSEYGCANLRLVIKGESHVCPAYENCVNYLSYLKSDCFILAVFFSLHYISSLESYTITVSSIVRLQI